MNTPWFWKARNAWYVSNGTSQIRLHEDEDEAYKQWHAMREAQNPEMLNAPFAALSESYLEETEDDEPTPWQEQAGGYIADFADWSKGPARKIKPADFTAWLDSHAGWGASSRRNATIAIKRVLNWAVDEEYLPRNPLAKVKRPKGRRREQLVPVDTHAAMMAKTQAAFRPFLIALRLSGTRPGMIRTVTAADVSAGGDMWVMRKHKTADKTERPLFVYLPPCLQTLTRILAAARPKGPLFRNRDGDPWTKDAIVCRMKRLRAALELPAGVVNYSYRHTMITNSLLAGNDIATTAELAGHADLSMIAKHYAHLDQAKEHLKSAAARAAKPNP